jgi:YVTN family beta-propeller protein
MPQIEIYSTDTDSGLVSVVGATNGVHHRIAQVSVGNAPRGPVEISRGQAVARMLLLYPDSLKAQLHVAGTEGMQ